MEIEITEEMIDEVLHHYQIYDAHRDELKELGFEDTPRSFSIFSGLLRFIKKFGDNSQEVFNSVMKVVEDDLKSATSDERTDE